MGYVETYNADATLNLIERIWTEVTIILRLLPSSRERVASVMLNWAVKPTPLQER
jgi:hypothetical protein